MKHTFTTWGRLLLAPLLLGVATTTHAQTYLMSNEAVNNCSGTFYDSGGATGEYNDGENFIKTFSPATPGSAVQLAFTQFQLDKDLIISDALYVYDGPTTTSKLLGKYSGKDSPGTITANNPTGQLTVRFETDPKFLLLGKLIGSTDAGWAATLACVAPAITSFSPASGSPGASVTITGTNLGNATALTFNGVPALFVVVSATQLIASVPAGATSGTIQVTVPGATASSATSFTVCGTQAIAQNVMVNLNIVGAANVTTAMVNNGSTTACGAASVGFLSPVERIANGTFDTNDAGWTTTNVNGVGGYKPAGGNPNGMFIINSDGNSATDPSLAQTITGLTIGETYLLQADYRNTDELHYDQTQATFSVDMDGASVLTRYNPGKTWTHLGYRFKATATAHTFRFRSEINGTDMDIAVDNISLRQLFSSFDYTCANVGANPVTLVATNDNGDVNTAAATVIITADPPAATTTWNGRAGTDPQDCRNWDYGRVPDATINVVLPGGAANYPNLSAGALAVNNLTIASGARLTVATGATLLVNGNWTNNSSTAEAADLNGAVNFIGLTTQTIGGATETNFASLGVNKLSGTLQLTHDLVVSTALALTNGTLTTGSYQVALADNAILSEKETSYVVGTVWTSRSVAANTAEAFGGLGLTMTPAAGSPAPGATRVVRTTGTALPAVGLGGTESVQRYYTIQPATNTGLNVTTNFTYFDHELSSTLLANRAKLAMYKSNATTGPWTMMGQNGSTANSLTKTGIASFATMTLSTDITPLPVVLTDFTAQLLGSAVHLAWATASEENSLRFDIERSTDGVAFTRLGSVAAAGSSDAQHAYAFTDATLPAGKRALYYRLRQLDAGGPARYSPVRTVLSTAGELTLFPNPARTATTLAGAPAGAVVQVLNAVGQVVATMPAGATGTTELALPAALSRGVYAVRVGGQTARLLVE